MIPKFKLKMAIKQIAPDGSFEGDLAVYNNIDLGGDRILPGAFTKTIKERGNQVPMLWQHKSDRPIGMLTLIDDPDALRVKGQLLMELPDAKNAYLLIKARIVKGLSIGFDTLKDAVENGVRQLLEIRLWEGSIVTFPMNEQALITSVKARKEAKEDFDTEYAEALLMDAAYQMWIALRAALCSIPWADLTREEKLAASEESIQQFLAAYMAMIPAYLDWLVEEYGDSMNYYGRKPPETKSGRKISAATKKDLSTARDHVKSADDLLIALLDSEADDTDDGEDTSEGKAAIKPVPEPAGPTDHSAAKALIDQMRTLIPAA
jgi:HK97 family phage prohead protease